MTNKNKKIFVFVFMIALVVAPMFATTMTSESNNYSLDLGFIKQAVNLIVGIFAGGYVLLKAAMDIFHAVKNSAEDPNGLKKAIGGLVLNIAILAGFMFVINYVFGSMLSSSSGSTTTSEEQQGFFGALTGALVQLGL